MNIETIIIQEQDFHESKYNTREWECSVNIKDWTHDYQKKEYIIRILV